MARHSLVVLTLVLVLAAISSAATLLIVDFELSGRDAHLERLERRLAMAPLDVVLMGDSVIAAHDSCDRHNLGIDRLLEERLRPFNLHSLNSGGLSIFIYRDYVRALRQSIRRPKLLLIEINPSILDFGSGMHPAGRFTGKRLHNAWRETREAALLVEYWRYRFGGEFNREVDAWRQTSFDIPGRGSFTRGNVEELLKRKHSIDCGSEKPSLADMQLAQGSRMSTRLTPQSEIWQLTSEIAQTARDQGIVVVFYLSPANIGAMDKYAGEALRSTWEANRAMLRERIEAQGSIFFDFSTLVAEQRFIDLLCICGHMNADGREQLADALATAVKPLLHR